jgi:hypothetical protein
MNDCAISAASGIAAQAKVPEVPLPAKRQVKGAISTLTETVISWYPAFPAGTAFFRMQ